MKETCLEKIKPVRLDQTPSSKSKVNHFKENIDDKTDITSIFGSSAFKPSPHYDNERPPFFDKQRKYRYLRVLDNMIVKIENSGNDEILWIWIELKQ